MQGLNSEQSELWEISRKLVAFNTVSEYSNVDAAEYLANYLEEIGFSVRLMNEEIRGVQKAMVLAWVGPEVPDGLIISGHIDVVPFRGQPGWNTDPQVLQSDGQRIFGRGVTDMKVFLAQALMAAKRYPLLQLKRPLMYLFTCDEEIAGQGSERLVEAIPRFFHNYPLPTMALIGEPTNFEIFSAHKGYGSFDISVRGKAGHSSTRDIGLNAINRMADIIQLVQETNASLQQRVSPENVELFPDIPYSAFNVAVIGGGLAANMIPEACRLTVSLRIAPGDDALEIVEALQQSIEQNVTRSMQAIAPDCGAFIENFIATPPLRSPAKGAFYDLLGRVMGKNNGRGVAFATDGGHLQKLGIQSYVCGPGLLSEAHQPNESLPLENFFSGVECLANVIHAWCMQ